MSTSTFGRLLGTLFGVTPQPQRRSDYPASHSSPVEVGKGGANERHIAIAGQPMLFRDEGGVVVQFRPAFDYELRPTAVGMKLIPALAPHWEVLHEHRGTLTDAIAAAVKGAQAARHACRPFARHANPFDQSTSATRDPGQNRGRRRVNAASIC